jgi:hypothetical protein
MEEVFASLMQATMYLLIDALKFGWNAMATIRLPISEHRWSSPYRGGIESVNFSCGLCGERYLWLRFA